MGDRALRVSCSRSLMSVGSLTAIYPSSYDAGEDNEISFKEGDRITHIEAASEDWWQGTDQHGNVGLFPGTYMSLRGRYVMLTFSSQRTMLNCRAEVERRRVGSEACRKTTNGVGMSMLHRFA